ncbi:histone-lysine N-methyltransferase SETMAR-like [Lepeophtheirus salmonis]|uniref:histone-lysine N-methyltransferase SETMAR-like n=1 Tax=Lepeophtheirus salmonis TaxID=72036 RepID=UPI001AE38DD4|nr:histone-lysine N-methyltransferase SETMAR-like [Lepeophtheirus salmonis]
MGRNTVQAQAWLEKCYLDSVTSKTTIKRWFADFKDGRMDTIDAERPGRPNDAVSPKNQTSAGKVMASVFWDSDGILFIDYLEHGKKSTANTISSIKTAAKLVELGFKLLLHPPYSPDVAPSGHWHFAELKKMFRGKRFGSDEEVTEAYFEDLNKSFYTCGIEMLEKRWNDCIVIK